MRWPLYVLYSGQYVSANRSIESYAPDWRTLRRQHYATLTSTPLRAGRRGGGRPAGYPQVLGRVVEEGVGPPVGPKYSLTLRGRRVRCSPVPPLSRRGGRAGVAKETPEPQRTRRERKKERASRGASGRAGGSSFTERRFHFGHAEIGQSAASIDRRRAHEAKPKTE